MNIKDTCNSMLDDLHNHSNIDKEDLFLQYVKERLDKSFNTYQKELDQGLAFLRRRNELNVMKKMKRLK